MIIQIIGLPGSGKTTLATLLADRIGAIHWNADAVRQGMDDKDFSREGRVRQAKRMGYLCREIDRQHGIAIADFICPTDETRKAFGKAGKVIWMDRQAPATYPDTARMWEKPAYDLHITTGLTPEQEVDLVIETFGLYDWKKPTVLMLGRYQPFHEGHEALYQEGKKRQAQVLVGVRHTHGLDEKNPLSFSKVKAGIPHDFVMKLPNITNIIYGRDVGYRIEHIDLPDHIKKISATEKRKKLGL